MKAEQASSGRRLSATHAVADLSLVAVRGSADEHDANARVLELHAGVDHIRVVDEALVA